MIKDLVPVRVKPGVRFAEAGKRFRGANTDCEALHWVEERQTKPDIFWIPRQRLKDLKDLVDELDPRLVPDSYPLAVREDPLSVSRPTKRRWLLFNYVRASAAEIQDGWLVYKPRKPKRPAWGQSGPLRDFVRIQTDDDIVDFAEKYGPFGASGREPLDLWYFLIETARDLLRYSNTLRKGEIPSEEWKRIHILKGNLDSLGTRIVSRIKIPDIPKDPTVALDTAWFLWCDCMNNWVQLGGVRPVIYWDHREKRPTWYFTGNTFGMIGLQLAEAGWQTCSQCGLPYPRFRPVPPSGRNYCLDCGDKAAAKQRQRRFRAKRSQEKRLSKTPQSRKAKNRR